MPKFQVGDTVKCVSMKDFGGLYKADERFAKLGAPSLAEKMHTEITRLSTGLDCQPAL